MSTLACEVSSNWPILMGLLFLAALVILAWPWLQRNPQFRSAVTMVVCIAAFLMLGGDTLLAVPNPDLGDTWICQYGLQNGWPCWVLQALFCPCSGPLP